MASRIIYQSCGAAVGGAGLDRVISASMDADLAAAATDVRVFGQLARIGSIYSSDIPCTATIGWLLWDNGNEDTAGLGGTNAAANFISDPVGSETTVGIGAGAEGEDVAGGTGLVLNNAVVQNYSATLSVGDLPSAECTWLGSSVSTGSATGATPTPNLAVPQAIRPQDVTVSISGFTGDLFTSTTFCAQSVNIEVPLARENVQCLGSATPLKYVQTPIIGTMTITANLQTFGDVNLTTIADGTRTASVGNATVTASNAGGANFSAAINNATIQSQSISVGLDDAMTVELVLQAYFGGSTSTDGIVL